MKRLAAALMLVFIAGAAQAANPFSVGISEGGAPSNGFFGWILAQQMQFEQGLTRAVHAVATSPSAAFTLAGLSFAYGVFHAAGPGHGKAVVASYLIANEKALKRGVLLSFLAALMQGVVAIVLVAVLALIVHATAQTMTGAAHWVELLSFAGIALLGAWLVWSKGWAFFAQFRGAKRASHHDHRTHHAHPSHDLSPGHGEAGHVHDEHCGHFHAPAPETLGEGFSWKKAIMTVVAAGSRPCSGAILVLVFALSQGIFWAGIVATLAMSAGTAITTSALASIAVLAKGLALKLTGKDGARAEFVLRGLEFVAACLVLVVGLGLTFGVLNAGV